MKAPKLILLFILISSVTLVECVGSEIPTKDGKQFLTGRGILPLQAETENEIRPQNSIQILFDIYHEPEYNASQLSGFWEYLNSTYTVTNNTNIITKTVLDDVDILLLIGPTLNFTSGSDGEIEAIIDFIQANGSLLIAPPLQTLTNLDELTRPFGFSFENNTVIDTTTNYDNSDIFVRVTEFDPLPLTANIQEIGFQGRRILSNSTWVQPWEYPTSFQNVSVDLHPFMWGSPSTTTQKHQDVTGPDVLLGIAMETSRDARLVGVGSSALFSNSLITLGTVTDDSGIPQYELQSAYGQTSVLVQNIIEWLAKRTGVITYRDFTVDVLRNNSRTTIDNGVPISASIVITDQDGSSIPIVISEDIHIFGIIAGGQFKRNVTMNIDPNGVLFSGTIDTTDLSRSWVVPTVQAHTKGYSYLEVSYGEVYVYSPPSTLYTDPLGIFFLLSLFANIGLFAFVAFWAWNNLLRPNKSS